MTLEQFLRQGIEHLNKPVTGRPNRIWEFLTFPVTSFFRVREETKGRKRTFGQKAYHVALILFFWAGLHSLIQRFVPAVATHQISLPVYILLMLATGYGFMLAFLLFIKINHHLSYEAGVRRRTLRAYRERGCGIIQFDQSTYPLAAEALRTWKPMPHDKAIKKYTEPVCDLLFLSSGIFYHDGMWRRLVSIRSIEENRAAGPEDDEEE